jgi:hypothetical protein
LRVRIARNVRPAVRKALETFTFERSEPTDDSSDPRRGVALSRLTTATVERPHIISFEDFAADVLSDCHGMLIRNVESEGTFFVPSAAL